MPKWLRVLLDTVGFSTIIIIFVGIPAMTLFVLSVWNALDFPHQVWAITTGSLFIISVILFVYIRTRKVLYILPTLLNKIHKLTIELASSISINDLSEEDFQGFFFLGKIDKQIQDLNPSVTDIPALLASIDKISDIANAGAEGMKKDADAAWRLHNYMFEKVGLKRALANNKTYIRLKAQLESVPIPSTEIIQAKLNCEYTTRIIGTWIPILSTTQDKKYESVVPLPIRVDAPLKLEETHNQWQLILAQLRTSIDSYYASRKR
jgi:hypothetical protein